MTASRFDPPRNPWMMIVAAIGVFAAGAIVMFLFLRPAGKRADDRLSAGGASSQPPAAPALPPASSEGPGDAPLPDVVVPIAHEAAQRAGIVTATVRTSREGSRVRIPGIVQPNAYRRIVVTPLVAGRVTRVPVELGARVARGATLAEIYSPDLADAQTRYLSMRAELGAAHARLTRTERLVQIGAASQQELEQVRAEHTRHATDVEGARVRLRLLGMTAQALAALPAPGGMSATVRVPAPSEGVVIERAANVGQVVDQSTALFTVADLSPVWIMGDLSERDFAAVRVGSPASVTTPAYPGLALSGRITYIAPDVRPETRTVQVRVEVPNPDGRLKFGMYVDVALEGLTSTETVVVPRTAIQTVGSRTVVYLGDPRQRGRFIEREVTIGDAIGADVQVRSGLAPGDVVVTQGSFHVRAERERLGLRAGPSPAPVQAAAPAARGSAAGVQELRVSVTDEGYSPADLSVRAGVPARLILTRTSDKTCGTDVVFPDDGIKRALPLNEPVTIDLVTSKAREINFSCGMGMLKGTVVVR